MNRNSPFALIAVFVLASLSCNIVDTVVNQAVNNAAGGNENPNAVSQLWPDVPKMDGLTSSPDAELPPSLKVVMRTGVNLMMKGLGEGGPEWDWIMFSTTKTSDDVKNFYTPERMAANGWEKDQSACLSGSQSGIAQAGVFCAFTKHQGDKGVGVMIFAVPDDQTKQTIVLFTRMEGTETPTAQQAQPTRGAITMLHGSAPYGIERRPMPNGLNLDQLLPKQVGPYTRVLIEKSEQRGVPPTSIQVDGNSIYATYRAGASEIFVEFAVNSSAANAQAALDTAASEVVGGKFPTDPKVGSIGTEPSYLKYGTFFAWTRGGYYFSASAKSDAALDAFTQAFPY